MTDKGVLETLEAHDGLALYAQFYPSANPVGAIVTVHDFGQHSGMYQAAHEGFAAKGFNVYTLDLRGHGQSPGERQTVDRFEDYLDDLDLLMARARDREQGRPLFLLGQGLGAIIALQFASSRRPNLNGLILMGRLPENTTDSMDRFLAHFAKWPLERAREAKTHLELEAAERSLETQAPFLPFPLLCLAEERDRLRLEKLHDRIITYDKTLIPYESTTSDILLHPGQTPVIEDIVDWCGALLEKKDENEEWDEDDSL